MATLRNQSAQYVQQATSSLPSQLVMTNCTDTVVPHNFSTETKLNLHTPTKLPPNKQQAPHTTTTDMKIPPQPILKNTRTELAPNKSTLAQTSSSDYIHNTDKDVRLPHTPSQTPFPPQTSQILAPTSLSTKTPSDSAPSPSLSEFRLNNSKSPTSNNYYDILPDEGDNFTFSPAPPPIPPSPQIQHPTHKKIPPKKFIPTNYPTESPTVYTNLPPDPDPSLTIFPHKKNTDLPNNETSPPLPKNTNTPHNKPPMIVEDVSTEEDEEYIAPYIHHDAIPMFPDPTDHELSNNGGGISTFPPLWLKHNPRVTMQLPSDTNYTKGYLIPEKGSLWTYLCGRTRKSAKRFILSMEQLSSLHHKGHMLRGHQHIITKSNNKIVEIDDIEDAYPLINQTTINHEPTSSISHSHPTPTRRMVDTILSSTPAHVVFTQDQLRKSFGFKNIDNISKHLVNVSLDTISIS
jgi:hypothetical protein